MPGDEFWIDEFGLPALNGAVECAVVWNGSLIVGGQFYQVGGVEATNIAQWDGTKWNSLGNGTDEVVLSLLVYDRQLVAAGRFTRAGDVDAPGIARWNGSEWSGLGSGLESPPYQLPHVASLATYRGALVATGDFTHSGSTIVSRVARWDGNAWEPLAEGLNGPGFALAALDDSLFVGGSFDHAGAETVSSLAKWDGATWSPVGDGVTLGASPGAVHALVVHQNRLFVGGEFDSVGGLSARNIASWGNGGWEALGQGIHARVTCLASYQGSLAAGLYFGSEGVHLWDGYTWTQIAPMVHGYAETLLPRGTDLIVGGSFRADTVPGGPIAGFNLGLWSEGRWVGYETWNDRMHGLSSHGAYPNVQGLCVGDDGIYAGGAIRLAGDPPSWVPMGTVTRWDGHRWQAVMPEPYFGTAFVLMAESDTLYAGGSFSVPSLPYPSGSNILRYTGGSWSPMGAIPNAVTSLARFQGALYLGARAGLYRWNGVDWDLVGATEPGGVMSLAIHNGKLVVGGEFARIGGLPAVNIATWDGTGWWPLGSGLPSDWFGVDGLADWSGKLVAAGSFPVLAGGGNSVAVWDGDSWERLGDLQGIGYTIGSVRGRLFAGGWFGYVRQHVEGLFEFNGSTWERVGSGVNGPVHVIAEWNGALVIAGEFSRAGGRSSFGIAIWDGLRSSAPVPRVPTLSANRPNPFRSETRFSLDLPHSTRVRVSVHDTRGRQVALIAEGVQSDGLQELKWNGLDARGRHVTTGVYFVRAELSDGTVLARKVLLLH